MRKPWRICSRCSVVYPGEVPLGDGETPGDGLSLTDLLIPLLLADIGGMHKPISPPLTPDVRRPLGQSADLGERAVSLGRGIHSCNRFIHRCNRADSPLMRQRMILRLVWLDVAGGQGVVQRNGPVYTLYIWAVSKAGTGENQPLQAVRSEHFLSGAGCDEVVHAP